MAAMEAAFPGPLGDQRTEATSAIPAPDPVIRAKLRVPAPNALPRKRVEAAATA